MIRPIEILIRVKDEATGMLTSVQAKVTALAAAVAAFFGVTLFAGAVKSAAEFEAALSRVKAATDASAQEMVALKQAAEDAGADTKYTSVQAANALENLAKAGLSANDAIKALPPVLSLAQAGDIELAQSSEMLTKAVMGMGLSFDQAGRVADVLAKGANASNTSVKGLAEALSYTAPVAHSLGLSLESTVAIIGKFADAGIDASRAGTALNSILSQFMDPSSKFRQELGAAGIVTTNFERALQQLAAAGPKGQKALLAVGLEAGPALRALLNQGMGALDELKAKLLDSAGSAARTAAIMEDNLPGAMNSLASAWDTVKNVLGAPVLPVLKDAVNELAGSLKGIVADGTVAKFGEAIAEAFRAGVKWGRDFLAQIDFAAITKSMQDFATRAQEAFTQVADYASTAGNSVKLAYGVMSAGANTVLAGIYGLGVAFTETAGFIVKGAASLSEALSKIAIGSAKQKLLDDAAQMREVLTGLSGVSDEFARRANTAMDAAAGGARIAQTSFAGLTQTLGEGRVQADNTSQAIAEVARQIEAVGQKSAAAAQASREKAAADTAVADSVRQLKDQYAALVSEGNLQAAADKLQEIDRIMQSASGAADAAKEAAARLEQAYTSLGLKTSKELNDAAELAKRSWDTLAESGVKSASTLRQAFESYARASMEAAERQGDAVASSTRTLLESQAASKGLKIAFDDAGKASVELGDSVTKTASASNRAAGSMVKDWTGVGSSINVASRALQEYQQRMAEKYGRPGEGDKGLFESGRRSTRGEELSPGVQEVGTGGYQFRNKEGMTSDAKGNVQQQWVWTRAAIIDYLKQAGMDELLAERLAAQFVQPDGSVPYVASEAQKKWGGPSSTLAEALGKMVDYYQYGNGKSEANTMLEYERNKNKTPSTSPSPAPSPTPSPAPAPGTGGTTYVNNITINGAGDWGVARGTTRHVDAQSAQTEIDLLRDLAQAKGAAI